MNPNPMKGRPPFYPARAEKGPCMNCERRHPGCHNKCPDYQAYKERAEDRKALERKRKEDDSAVDAFKALQTLKIARRKPHER